jgi:uncharacterized protein (TIGR03000 family)
VYYSYCPPPVYYYYCPPIVSYADARGTSGGEQGQQASSAFSDDDKKQLKAAGASDEQIADFVKQGFGHEDMQECIKALKEANKPDSPFTEEDKKKLRAAGATDEQIADLVKQGFGHERLKDCLDAIGESKKKGGEQESRRNPNAATVIVHLPAEAKLTVDGEPTTVTSNRRVFLSPPLPVGKVFYYILEAERMVDGVKQSVTAKVLVSAGQESTVTMDFPKESIVRK